MTGQRRSRHLRRQRARLARDGHPTQARRDALKAAARERDEALRKLRGDIQPKIDRLHAELVEKRREIWDDYDQGVALIGKAHILSPAGAEQ